MDVGIAGLMIGVLWPVFALAALLIKLESPGPVLIKQDRIGLGRQGLPLPQVPHHAPQPHRQTTSQSACPPAT